MTIWDDAEIAIDIQHTEPGTTLDDHLRKEQTRAVLDLLADYKRKLDKNGDAQPEPDKTAWKSNHPPIIHSSSAQKG